MFGNLGKKLVEGLDVKGVIGTVFGDKTQKEANKLEFEKLEKELKERLINLADAEEQRMFELRKAAVEADTTTNQAAFNFMTAEVTQGDNYTKRARPTNMKVEVYPTTTSAEEGEVNPLSNDEIIEKEDMFTML
jgi:hypothetical protein